VAKIEGGGTRRKNLTEVQMVKIIILISVLAVISFYAARAGRIETAGITSPTIST
jgi:hypothetical protein